MLKYCHRPLNTTEGAVAAWFEIGAATQLDKWVLGTGRVDGCPFRENENCDPDFGKDCFDSFQESKSEYSGIDMRKRAAWWIFQGVMKVKSKFSSFCTILIEENVAKGFTVGEIVKDLGATPETGGNVGKWFSLAFGIASTPVLEDEYSKLGQYTHLSSGIGNKKPVTEVGRFFAQVPWLLDYNSTRIETIEHFKKAMRTKLAHAGHQWIELDGKHYCTLLATRDTLVEPDEDFYNGKMPKHGIWLHVPYYENIRECGLKLGNSSGAYPEKLVGGYPSCWFQMDLLYADGCFRPQVTQENTVGCINDAIKS
ncbi:hypothetical protein F53441_12989 [Fusarium austroafricanum]|uniref:Uncharacterized protein n=1 Tax=Fusarium austroafricanum TaxID=2364996 RepID=A0A8H4NH43_9HYPO|nr:hypothetical protein F53441_12989 [Fusarium austroafricanum]